VIRTTAIPFIMIGPERPEREWLGIATTMQIGSAYP
jgi:hypothetical protein